MIILVINNFLFCKLVITVTNNFWLLKLIINEEFFTMLFYVDGYKPHFSNRFNKILK